MLFRSCSTVRPAASRAARNVAPRLASTAGPGVFEPLGSAELTRIVDLQIALLGTRLADRRLVLTVTPAAREWLSLTGYDPVYGARPLRRLVQKAIGDRLARALLSGHVRDGDEVVVDRVGDDLDVTRSVL